MRWKLASGGVVASTKQPLQNKDFDRVVITDNSSSYGTFEDSGIPDVNNEDDIEFTVTLYNPSSHMIRKSHNGNIEFMFGPKLLGNTGNSNGAKKNWKNPYTGTAYPDDKTFSVVNNIEVGDVIELTFHPYIYEISVYYTHTVNPFEYYWNDNHIDLNAFENDYWIQPYILTIRTGGVQYTYDLETGEYLCRGHYTDFRRIQYNVTYEIR